MVFNYKNEKEAEEIKGKIYDEWRRLLDFALAHPQWSMEEVFIQYKKEKDGRNI
jgi:hypothetical protein